MTRADLEQRLQHAQSYQDWIAALAAFFAAHDIYFGHGTDNASDEAFWLVRHLQDWQDIDLDQVPDARLTQWLIELAGRRVEERRPLAYLLGEAWFAGLRFRVDQRVLIPRSPLAEVIERGFEPWCRLRPRDRVLDVGTGCGCLAIAAAYYCADVHVDATEVSADALTVAAENVAAHGLGERVRLLEADLLPRAARGYRVIMSNPPYVPTGELAMLPSEYRHEPAAALDGGPDGLGPTIRLLERAAAYLVPNGLLCVEVGGVATTLADRYPDLPAVWLEFERGGEGVFVVSREDLIDSGFGPQHT